MSQAIAPDITSPDFWAWADKQHPGAVAATIDGGGLMALHTAGPQYFESAKRWVPHPQGIRINLSLVAVGSKRDPSIAWHPEEAKAALGKAQAEEFTQSTFQRRSPVSITAVPPKPKIPHADLSDEGSRGQHETTVALKAILDDLRDNPETPVVTNPTSSAPEEGQTILFTPEDLRGIRHALTRAVEDITAILAKTQKTP